MVASEGLLEHFVINTTPSVMERAMESTTLLSNSGSEQDSTWSAELKTLGRYCSPLIIANILQFSINMSSLLVISSRGKIELGAVSIATTTANITGFIIFQGLSTSLDTLCAQACGSGKPHLTRLHVQKMILLLGAVSIPMSTFWFFADTLFSCIIPDTLTATLAGSYLRILIFAIPGFIGFEAGKRILTSQGKFLPVMGILCAGACTNAYLGWLLVWHYDLGFRGAPIAVATTWTLITVYFCLYLYVSGEEGIWPFKLSRTLKGWGPMLGLALPGLVMVEGEYLAFEILLFASAQLSTADLAAQTILVTLNSILWQVPFSISAAGTTMIAQRIGAGLTISAKTCALVVFASSFVCSASNGGLLFGLRAFWPTIFTDDSDVIVLVQNTLPLVAFMQLFDGLAACSNGILRGIGKPAFGGWVNLTSYYLVALPVSFWMTFGFHWNLIGLWTGVTPALVIVTFAKVLYCLGTDWQKSVDDAGQRNSCLTDLES